MTLRLLSVGFAVFVLLALYLGWHAQMLSFAGPLAGVKILVWSAFLAFTGYSAYCSAKEDLFATVRRMAEWHWGRQIGVDLYIGLLLSVFVVYLNEGSALVTLCWLVPVLLFGNLATLLYVVIHFDRIVAHFLT